MVVVVTEPDGTETTLEGPVVVIDTTPPEVVIEGGVVSTDDIVNAEDHADGIEIVGSGEPGAEIAVVIEGVTETTVIGEDGQWQVVFDPADIPGGEREVDVVITATDGFGNATVVTDVVAIDTVPHPLPINTGAVGGDGVVNAEEEAVGVVITGTSTPGATVTVTVAGVSRDVIVGEAEKEAAKRRRAQADEDSNRVVQRLEGQLSALSRQVGEAGMLRETAKANLDLFQAQYDAGQREVMDVVGVYDTFAQRQARALALKYELALAHLQLARHLGVLAEGSRI